MQKTTHQEVVLDLLLLSHVTITDQVAAHGSALGRGADVVEGLRVVEVAAGLVGWAVHSVVVVWRACMAHRCILSESAQDVD
jgi:hypothetical protein